MKIFLVHPRRGENRPQAAYARREDLPIYSSRDDEIVELAVVNPPEVAELASALRALTYVDPDKVDAAFERAQKAFTTLFGVAL